MPSLYIQGFGNPVSQIKNKPIAFFAQDTWKATRRLTLNYGIRYDVEFTQTIAPVGITDPLSRINLSDADILAAQDAVGVQQGIPRDTNNFAPRFGFAYDIFGDGKTVVRGALGLFYDHPLLAAAFNSDIADAAQQQQAVLTAGSPVPTTFINAAQVFQGTVCVPGSTSNPLCAPGVVTPGVAREHNINSADSDLTIRLSSDSARVLPFTLPIAKDFQYASATQANLTFERQLTKNMAVTASYIYVGAHHLPHPTDVNTPNTALQIQNFQRFTGRLPISTQEAVAFSIPTTGTAVSGRRSAALLHAGNSGRNTRSVSECGANLRARHSGNYYRAFNKSGKSRGFSGGCQLFPSELAELLSRAGFNRRRGYAGSSQFAACRNTENARTRFAVRRGQRADF